MKNILIAGPSRAGKSSLAARLGQALGHFVIHLDKLAAAFQGAWPHMEIGLGLDRDQTSRNLAPFLGHWLGLLSSGDGRGLLPYSHGAAKGNRFIVEGGYWDFGAMAPFLAQYGIRGLKERFILIGLAQTRKTAGEFFADFRKHDTEDDWTRGLDDGDLREFCEKAVPDNRAMSGYLRGHGFAVYDTGAGREQVFDGIIAALAQESPPEETP